MCVESIQKKGSRTQFAIGSGDSQWGGAEYVTFFNHRMRSAECLTKGRLRYYNAGMCCVTYPVKCHRYWAAAQPAKSSPIKNVPKGGGGGRGAPPPPPLAVVGPPRAADPRGGSPLSLRPKNGFQGPREHHNPQKGPPGAG